MPNDFSPFLCWLVSVNQRLRGLCINLEMLLGYTRHNNFTMSFEYMMNVCKLFSACCVVYTMRLSWTSSYIPSPVHCIKIATLCLFGQTHHRCGLVPCPEWQNDPFLCRWMQPTTPWISATVNRTNSDKGPCTCDQLCALLGLGAGQPCLVWP